MAKVPKTAENEALCACPRCPTHDKCAKEKKETLYCATGKSACELVDRGCICGACPLWEKYSLSKGFFCLNGSAE
jgi:hypothetical protein